MIFVYPTFAPRHFMTKLCRPTSQVKYRHSWCAEHTCAPATPRPPLRAFRRRDQRPRRPCIRFGESAKAHTDRASCSEARPTPLQPMQDLRRRGGSPCNRCRTLGRAVKAHATDADPLTAAAKAFATDAGPSTDATKPVQPMQTPWLRGQSLCNRCRPLGTRGQGLAAFTKALVAVDPISAGPHRETAAPKVTRHAPPDHRTCAP